MGSSVKQASADAASAKTTADDAAAKTEAAANRVAQLFQDANSKLVNKSRRSMMKLKYRALMNLSEILRGQLFK